MKVDETWLSYGSFSSLNENLWVWVRLCLSYYTDIYFNAFIIVLGVLTLGLHHKNYWYTTGKQRWKRVSYPRWLLRRISSRVLPSDKGLISVTINTHFNFLERLGWVGLCEICGMLYKVKISIEMKKSKVRHSLQWLLPLSGLKKKIFYWNFLK